MTTTTKAKTTPASAKAEPNSSQAKAATTPAKAPSKLDTIEALLLREKGASIAEMMAATGWQQHSVRGALAGALKKRGLAITSEKIEGERRYRATREEAVNATPAEAAA